VTPSSPRAAIDPEASITNVTGERSPDGSALCPPNTGKRAALTAAATARVRNNSNKNRRSRMRRAWRRNALRNNGSGGNA
jgi:hypothetical protein